MNLNSLQYFDYPEHVPQINGLYVCKVHELKIWGEWQTDKWYFGSEYGHSLLVSAWADGVTEL